MHTPLKEILDEALLDEIKARDTYRGIIEAFGPVRPFINIVEAEQRHMDALLSLYERHGIPLPAFPDPDDVELPGGIEEACGTGVAAELDNIALYDRLVAATDLPDVRSVLQRLQAASRDHHLPAFQHCVERGGSGGGRGRQGRFGART